MAALRWLARGAAIASTSGSPRSTRPVRVCRTVVMMVAPPGEPSARTGLAVLRARSSARSTSAAACPAPAGSGRAPPGSAGAKEKSVSSLLSRKPAPRHGDAAAAGRLDGQGVGDDVAPLVGGREVRGVLALVRRRGGLARRARTRAGCARVAGRERAGQDRVVLDQAGPRVGEPLGEQLLRRYVLEGRVADPAAPVREGDPAGLDVAVQVLRLGGLREVGALQDVERLADARTAGGGGRHAVDVEAAVARPWSAPAACAA